MHSTHRHCKSEKFENAFEMRQNPTPAEAALWRVLSDLKVNGAKFRRQTVMLGWILDLYCPSSRIAVEADGGYHASRAPEDLRRDRILFHKHGVVTLRFTNDAILADPDAVADFIFDIHLDLPKYKTGTAAAKCPAARRTLQDHASHPSVAALLRNISC